MSMSRIYQLMLYYPEAPEGFQWHVPPTGDPYISAATTTENDILELLNSTVLTDDELDLLAVYGDTFLAAAATAALITRQETSDGQV
jgi:hypothetical protein